MIVYREQEQQVLVKPFLETLLHHTDPCELRGKHESAQELLIEMGKIEAAVADSLMPNADSLLPLLQTFREAILAAGHILYHCWFAQFEQTAIWLEKVKKLLQQLLDQRLPEVASVRVPEGYAYYALYPELYIESARRFIQDNQPQQAVCIGIRSIGTSLSAVVGATLQELGCKIYSYTVRPRYHPFQRRIVLKPELAQEFHRLRQSHFLVIDEGPGLSGSSFASVAEKLSEIGIPDERITFFPSWEADGQSFVSETARMRWQRHRNYATCFDDRFIQHLNLTTFQSDSRLIDISAGKWRYRLYPAEAKYPAVQPQHERRKYLSIPTSKPANHEGDIYLYKFTGLGQCGKAKLSRALLLAEAGVSPPVKTLANGFLAMQYIEGRPLFVNHRNQQFLNAVALYLAMLKRYCPGNRPVPYNELMEMIEIALSEGCVVANETHIIGKIIPAICNNETTAIDGRMLPHEWLQTATGYVKTDALDHHDDHFFPGCQDIAWDVAGVSVEFHLDSKEESYLVNRYQTLSGDNGLIYRLPFYRLAYTCYRLGYCTLAASAVATQEAQRFQQLIHYYRTVLEHQVMQLAA